MLRKPGSGGGAFFSIALLFASISTAAVLWISSTYNGSCLDTQDLLWILHASLCALFCIVSLCSFVLLSQVTSNPLPLHSLSWLTFLPWLLGWPLVSVPSPHPVSLPVVGPRAYKTYTCWPAIPAEDDSYLHLSLPVWLKASQVCSILFHIVWLPVMLHRKRCFFYSESLYVAVLLSFLLLYSTNAWFFQFWAGKFDCRWKFGC